MGAGLPDAKAGDVLRFMADLMEAGKLPSEFLDWTIDVEDRRPFFILPLPLDPATVSIFDASQEACTVGPNQTRGRFMRLAVSHAKGTKINCPERNNMYLLSDETDIVDDLGNEDIFVTGAGNDVISVGRGRSIFVMQKNWGKHTINKACRFSNFRREPDEQGQDDSIVYRTSDSAQAVVGIGISFTGSDRELKITATVPFSPADQAGLKPGDIISAIDGMPISDEPAKQIQGMAGTSLTLTVRSTGETVPVIKKLVRAAISRSAMEGTTTPDPGHYAWPYPYANFILFGAGIHRADITWDASAKVMTNRATGDQITFNLEPCFNFIFSEND